jgi:hypothetical protein
LVLSAAGKKLFPVIRGFPKTSVLGKAVLNFTMLFIAAAFPLFARDVRIFVEDTDLGLPLEGAVIRSWDGKEYVCDEEGSVLITLPDDRPVVIRAAYPGYENGRLVAALNSSRFTIKLALSGIMEGRELVIEAVKPGTNETKTGRSVAVSETEITRSAEIGLIEDVMTTIKLLPGVGYAGFFNAMPSIRGGDPGDLAAALDGFYIQNPYHWGGGYSIFDPKMVQSAQLSHGVFSVRYGHTISGLLEVSSKKPSPEETELELGISTSAANLNLSFPLFGKGGLMFMGKVTYYDPFVWTAKQAAKKIEQLQVINFVKTAPFIRSFTFTGDYRFADDLELSATGFFGSDGIGLLYESEMDTIGFASDTTLRFDWSNYQGFLLARLSYNPRKDMLFKISTGAGFMQANMDSEIIYDVKNRSFSPTFLGLYGTVHGTSYDLFTRDTIREKNTTTSVQGRIDYDWDIGKGFLFAAGIQENYSMWFINGDYNIRSEIPLPSSLFGIIDSPYVNYPLGYSIDVSNHILDSSAYALAEYNSRNRRFGAELGVRGDFVYFMGRDFNIHALPAVNPRLNLDFGILKNKGGLESLTAVAGTGLFSSMTDVVSIIEPRYNIEDFELRPNRSWTSVIGAKAEFGGGLSLNVEAYYKYVYDRMYAAVELSPYGTVPEAYFDGEGRIWGIDVMIQKMQSRYWDGWLSYSFNHSRYRDPGGLDSSMSVTGGNAGARGDIWYYPGYHRFHNLNLVLNIKPLRQFNIFTRLGLASGVPLPKIENTITSYPVYLWDKGAYIEKWKRSSRYDDDNRTTWSIPLDIKFSIYKFNRTGKAQSEVYIAVENSLSLIYTSKGNTSFNSYTGEEDTGSMSASYELPIPMISFGYKWSY